jgi:hypothetical protein
LALELALNKHSQKGYQLGCRCLVCKKAKHDEYVRHKETYLARVKAHKKTPAGKFTDKAWRLKKRYGITGKEYQALLEAQGSSCLICSVSIEGSNIHLDHDHATGKFRGFLCRSCNFGLGCFKDSIEFMEKAIEYLKEKK